jgi:TonB family protein
MSAGNISKRRRGIVILCSVIFICFLSPAVASEKILINIHLFKGTYEGSASAGQIQVLSTTSHPELSSIRDKLENSESALSAAVIEFLMDSYDMQVIEDVFSHERPWNGSGNPKFEDLILGGQGHASYQIRISPKKLPRQEISLSTVISETKKTNLYGGWVRIVDQDLILEIGEPVIICVPFQGQMYFVLVFITAGTPSEKWRHIPQKSRERKPIELGVMPDPITRVNPSYPEELRRRMVGGKIDLKIIINERGTVERVEVVNSLHPYLNYSAVQAFRQWTFEPVRIKGKLVPAQFRCTYSFDPRLYWEDIAWSQGSDVPDPFSSEELRKVLRGSAQYCRKLTGALFDFICEETIKETHYNLLKNINWIIHLLFPRAVPSGPGDSAWPGLSSQTDIAKDRTDTEPRIVRVDQIMDPKKTFRNSFLCDYLIAKKAGGVEERRIILEENGRRLPDRSKILEEKRFTDLSSLFAPLRVIANDRQSRFAYRLLKEESIHGKKAHLVEALPRSENDDSIWSARIWVDKNSFQILKCEIEGVPIDGYEDVLNDCAILNIKPTFLITHEYRHEKDGILFPFRSKVRVAYPGIDFRGPIEKIKIDFGYDKYKFFTVQTDAEVIK